MRTHMRGAAIVGSWFGASATLAATLGPVSVTVYPGNQVSFQGFDPARGQLRCVRVSMGVTWSASGDMEIQNTGGAGQVSATMCVGASCGIGHIDAVGYVSHVGAGGCSEIMGTCNAPLFQYCTFPFAVSDSVGATGLVTSPGYLAHYTGVGTRWLAGGSSYVEQLIASSPGCGVGLNVNSFAATPAFLLQYIYTPVSHCPGDVNSDGVVDFLDLNGVLSTYSETGPCAQGDVNNDNVVDFLDLNEILSYYGLACAATATPMGVTPPPSASTR